MAPGSISYHICFQSTFICIFTFCIYIIKYQKYIYLIVLSQLDLTFAVTRKGLATPLTRRVASGCYLCAGLFRFCCVVLLLVRYLGFITEGNTYHRCATSSSPLGGNTDVVLADIIKGISGAVAGEDLQHNQVPNHKSHLLAIYIICHLSLVFLSPTS